MKKGFTLVEMLIVVVVLVTLMTIAVRLSSTGDEQERRNKTIARIQRVENCLSGYYAAFGTYPPVRLHGSRDYNFEVGGGPRIQKGSTRQLQLNWYKEGGNHGIGSDAEKRDWRQVDAACRAQPVAARFPFPEGYNEVLKARAELAKERLAAGEDEDGGDAEHSAMVNAGYDDGYTENSARYGSNINESDWRKLQLFQFGLMSFLLPRYFFMMHGDNDFFDGASAAQWNANNVLPTDELDSGARFTNWQKVREKVENWRKNDDKAAWASIATIPSQAVCARWLPNLEKNCVIWHTKSLFGVELQLPGDNDVHGSSSVFSPMGSNGPEGRDYYMLDIATVTDGWEYELYYYSPAPYQSYVLWSAGANHRTFPPWAAREKLTSEQNKCVGAWIEDDIIHMSN